jgi:Lon protease-like protein
VARISIFPLSGAILYPGLTLPLHIFEPRYCAMVSDRWPGTGASA